MPLRHPAGGGHGRGQPHESRQAAAKHPQAGVLRPNLVPQNPNDEPASVVLEAHPSRTGGGRRRPPSRIASQGAASRSQSRDTAVRPIRREPRDHILLRGPEALELLQRAPGRRPVLRRLPGAAHLPHLPQDDARAHAAALHFPAGVRASSHSRGLRLARPSVAGRLRAGVPLPSNPGDPGPDSPVLSA